MTYRDKIDNWEEIFVTNIYEPEPNKIAIEVALGFVEEAHLTVQVSKKYLTGSRILFDNDSEKYTLLFDSYVSYWVINESYEIGLPGEYRGHRIREYSQSAFIDFCKSETSGFAILRENELRHFAIVTQNLIINILTASPIEITRLKLP